MRHVKPIPSIETIADVINKELRHFGPEVQVIAEPGRYLVSDAGYFICRVVGTATRNDQRWMYWDAGVFGGVIETTEGLRYNIYTDRDGEPVAWNVAGPTCDSVDVGDARGALPGGPAGRRLHLHQERRRVHHRVRQQLQRVSAARTSRHWEADARVAQDFWASSGFTLLDRRGEGLGVTDALDRAFPRDREGFFRRRKPAPAARAPRATLRVAARQP